MAEEEKENTAGEQAAKEKKSDEETPKSGKKKKILIVGAIVAMVLLAELAAAFFIVKWIKGDDPTQTAMDNLKEEEKKKLMMQTRIGSVLEEPITVTVNIAGSEGDHYLKTSIQLEWEGEKYSDLRLSITDRKVKIQDIIINILSTQSLNDLLKSSGKQRIREAIVSEVNAILPPESGHITNVFFLEFIVQ